MYNIKGYILEKLILNKNIIKYNTNQIYHIKTKKIDISIKLPFKLYFPAIEKTAEILEIEQSTDEFNDIVWYFYEYEGEGVSDKNRLQVIRLSEMGISNVFIKGPADNYKTNTQPLVYNINGKHIGKRLTVELDDYKNTVIKENLVLNKNISAYEDYWFNKKQGIKLPFDLTISELNNKTITITRIEYKKHTKNYNKDLWELYDENDSHICTLYDLVLRTLLFNKTNRKVAILKIYDEELKKQVRNPDSVVFHYKDNLNKILQESIQESQDEPLKYSNIILLNPEEDSVLILRRANYMKTFRGMYGFPGGHVDTKDKDSKATALRELKEETGIELTWNEEHKCKKYDSIKNEDGSISDYWITTLETTPEIKLSREHAGYEWFNDKSKKNHKWMPDVFKIIQKIL